MRLVAVLLLLALLAPSAAAHAVLVRGDPPPNGHAEEGRTFIELHFSQRLERRFTDADLVDTQGVSWKNGLVQIDPEAGTLLFPVRPLDSGVYAVQWRALSADGHVTRGAYIVSAGVAALSSPGPSAPYDPAGGAPVAESIARAAFGLGLALALGAPVLALRLRAADPRALPVAGAFALAGASGALVLALLTMRAAQLDAPALLATRAGASIAWRGGLLAASGSLLVLAAIAPERPRRGLAALALVLAGAALAAAALGSHAAARVSLPLLATGMAVAHALAASVWAGGALALALAWRDPAARADLGARLAPSALVAAGVLAATGAFGALLHAGAPGAWASMWGALIVAKSILLLALLGLATRRPRRVRLGATVLALALVASGVLASSAPPARPLVEGEQPERVLARDETTATMHVIFLVRPPEEGAQRLTVLIHPLTGATAPAESKVDARLLSPSGEERSVTFERTGDTEWEAASNAHFDAPGTWKVYLLVATHEETTLEFEVPIAPRRA